VFGQLLLNLNHTAEMWVAWFIQLASKVTKSITSIPEPSTQSLQIAHVQHPTILDLLNPVDEFELSSSESDFSDEDTGFNGMNDVERMGPMNNHEPNFEDSMLATSSIRPVMQPLDAQSAIQKEEKGPMDIDTDLNSNAHTIAEAASTSFTMTQSLPITQPSSQIKRP
jgi:hypothetical protein